MGRWKWENNAWWCRVDHQEVVNLRLKRRVSRAVKLTLEQESRRWREGLGQLWLRVD